MNNDKNQDNLSFLDDRYGSGTRVRHELEQYSNNGSLAIRLVVDGQQGDSFDGQPWAHATVNMSSLDSDKSQKGVVALKDWSENEGMPALMIKAGIVSPHNDQASGVQMYILTERAMELAADVLDAPLPKKKGARP